MEENIQQSQQPAPQPVQQPVVQPAPQQAKPEKKGEEEFSIGWHLKVLAAIYAVLFVFYLILKFTLK